MPNLDPDACLQNVAYWLDHYRRLRQEGKHQFARTAWVEFEAAIVEFKLAEQQQRENA